MKNLLYKELKLSVHILCYLFTVGFSFMVLIPNYPSYVSCIYVLASYSILFLGVNKGQSTNDLLYTCNLPIRKSDAVKARLISISFLHAVQILSVLIFIGIGKITGLNSFEEENMEYLGIGKESIIAMVALIILGYGIHDLIYLPWFYKTGRSIIGPTFVGILFFLIYAGIFMTAIPMAIPSLAKLLNVREGGTVGIIVQISLLLVCIAVYFGLRVITYKISSKRLEKIDL